MRFHTRKWLPWAIGLVVVAVAWLLIDVPLSASAQVTLEGSPMTKNGVGMIELEELAEIGRSREIRNLEVWQQCAGLHRVCVNFALRNDVPASDPDDATYRRKFEELDQLALGEQQLMHGGSEILELIDGSRDVYISELVSSGTISPSTVASALRKHRKQLASTNTLLEKMVLVAVVGIDLSAANVALANDPGAWSVLEPYLQSLSTAEIGYERMLAGELLFSLWMLDEQVQGPFLKRNHVINLMHQFNASHLDAANASWVEFWGAMHSVDRPSWTDYLIDPLGTYWTQFDESWSYLYHIASIRNLDAILAILAALYGSQTINSNDLPLSQPLPLWAWSWRDDNALCLDPQEVHPSMEQYADSICVPYLSDLYLAGQ